MIGVRDKIRRLGEGLFAKYVLALVGLVVFVLAVNGAIETFISYEPGPGPKASRRALAASRGGGGEVDDLGVLAPAQDLGGEDRVIETLEMQIVDGAALDPGFDHAVDAAADHDRGLRIHVTIPGLRCAPSGLRRFPRQGLSCRVSIDRGESGIRRIWYPAMSGNEPAASADTKVRTAAGTSPSINRSTGFA